MQRSVMMFLAAILGVACLSGCAAVQKNQANNQLLKDPVDSRYMTAVENMGNRVGNRVYWVHPPKQQKRGNR